MWSAYKGKSPQTPELVSALTFREWTCPNLKKLWLGKAVEDKNRRMRAFLACMKSDTPILHSKIHSNINSFPEMEREIGQGEDHSAGPKMEPAFPCKYPDIDAFVQQTSIKHPLSMYSIKFPPPEAFSVPEAAASLAYLLISPLVTPNMLSCSNMERDAVC
ncbi:hypothetical protein P7K49_038477 [Saguinus oedipus]|uniref:Uncharacterized protein n=1 Tax=Saguinus oedipus TaxID=9490 RepID=A0ABQ9TEU6_SAGOE|nr:hypothetical protein P7K49_038477 [Saguinus oedipus]